MRKKRSRTEPEQVSFWQSYSDMMAALLLVFVLIIAAAKFSYDHEAANAEKARAELDQKRDELDKLAKELDDDRKKTAEMEEKLKEQRDQIDQLIGVRTELIEKLKNAFNGTNLQISVDTDTGAISFESSVLFDFNQATLKESGESFPTAFFPKYFEVILSDDFKEYVAEVIIEGHTDNKGEYLYNLDLSQRRAFAVAEFCLADGKMFSTNQIGAVRKLITANGRSSNDLIYTNGEVDPDASRRVEIKFRLTEEEMIKQMSEILEE